MSSDGELAAAATARDLVPGDPAQLNLLAASLQAYADDLARAATGFASLTTEYWNGQAADQFRAKFAPAPARWHTAADAFGQASRAVSVYATSLLLAQDDAADALNRWRRGAQAGGAHFAAAGSLGAAAPPGTTEDPGSADRRLAIVAVDDARDRVRAAGISAHNAVRAATAGAPQGPSWWDTVCTDADALFTEGAHVAYDDVLIPVINELATIGQAVTMNPTAAVSIVGGVVLVVLGAAGDAAGGAACATGAGCVIGAPAITASTATIMTGVGLIGGGAISLGTTAGANPVTIVERTGSSGPNQPPSPPRIVNPSSPASSPIWKATKPYRGKYRSNGAPGKNRRYYRWDYTHNDIEVYDDQGWHTESIDPVTGEQVKGPPKTPRRVQLK